MNKEIKVTGIYRGQEESIMIAGVVFKKNHVRETLVGEKLYLTLEAESEKGGWFEIKQDSYKEYLAKRGRTHFRDVEIKVGKDEVGKDEVAEEVESAEETKAEAKNEVAEEVVEEPKEEVAEESKKRTKKSAKKEESAE